MKTILIGLCLCGVMTAPLFAQQATKKKAADSPVVAPTHGDVKYGPDERHLMDVWLADSKTPTPVVISIHGGAFRHGEKSVSNVVLRDCLEAGISVVAITYRFSDKHIAPAQHEDAARGAVRTS